MNIVGLQHELDNLKPDERRSVHVMVSLVERHPDLLGSPPNDGLNRFADTLWQLFNALRKDARRRR